MIDEIEINDFFLYQPNRDKWWAIMYVLYWISYESWTLFL